MACHLPVEGASSSRRSDRTAQAVEAQPYGGDRSPASTPFRVPAAHKHKKQDLLQPCDTAYPVFVHQTALREANGTVECRACQK